MDIRITTLIENSPDENSSLHYEHGISFYIEKGNQKLLFDTGQSSAFIENAEQLGKDLTALDHVVLSHGHYDHTGGFTTLCKKTNTFHLHIKKGLFQKKYTYKNDTYTFKGNNFDEQFLQKRGIAYAFIEQDVTEITDGVYVLTNFPRIYTNEIINQSFQVETESGYRQDYFEDEVLLAIDTSKGLVVILGCSHPGVRNMLDHVKLKLQRPIYAVLGGTHLKEADAARIEDSVAYLVREVDGPIGVSHCTGDTAMRELQKATHRYFHNKTGSEFTI